MKDLNKREKKRLTMRDRCLNCCVKTMFPNEEVILRVYITLMLKNCTNFKTEAYKK